jgi:hypothetical protein
VKRWPHHIERDPRVIVGIEGIRVRARAERVAHGSDEYLAARAGRRAKFATAGGVRETTESGAAGAIVRLGSELTGEAEAAAPSDRLYRIVAP